MPKLLPLGGGKPRRLMDRLGFLAGGTDAVPLLAAPNAPTLALTTGPADNTPSFTGIPGIGESFEVGDTLRLLSSLNSDLSDATTSDNTVDAGEFAAQEVAFTTGTLADGHWYFGLRHLKPGHATSNTSLIVDETIDTTAPTITSANTASVAENTTAVLTVTATDAGSGLAATPYSITGGADQAKFTINSTTGALVFASAPDFETPTDAGTNNVYNVTVGATDVAGNTGTMAIAVTVTDVAEGGASLNAAGSKQYGSAGTSKNYTGLTIGAGSNRALVVALVFGHGGTPPTGVAMTWNGVALTKIISVDSASNASTHLWGLVAPATGAQTLAISWTGTAEVFVVGIAFNGVDQTGGATTFPNSTSSDTTILDSNTVAVTSAAGNFVVGCSSPANSTYTFTGTPLFEDYATGSFVNAEALYDVGAATVNVGATRTPSGNVALKPLVATDVKAA